MSKQSLDYEKLCCNYYSSWEDGCCMESCEYYHRDECPIIYIKELLAEKDQTIADLEAELAEKEADIIALDTENYSFKQQIDNLRQQLAEKEQIIDWQNEIVEGVKQEEELLSQKLKSLGVDCIEDLGKTHNQDKISFAVEQLEKVKDFCEGIGLNMVYVTGENPVNIHMVIGNIDNQIKQLKEGK